MRRTLEVLFLFLLPYLMIAPWLIVGWFTIWLIHR